MSSLLATITALEQPKEGWGPIHHQASSDSSNTKSEILSLPTNLFHIIPSKTSIGKIADWTSEPQTTSMGTSTASREYQSTSSQATSAASNVSGAIAPQDDFSLVMSTQGQRKSYNYAQKRRPNQPQTKSYSQDQTKQAKQQRKKRTTTSSYYQKPKTQNYKPSIKVKKSWVLVDKFAFGTLKKATTDPLDSGKGYKTPEPVDKYVCGKVGYYDKKFDRASAKQPIPLDNPKTLAGYIIRPPASSEDPTLSNKISPEANVFATDDAIATLMAAAKSELPWDMAIRVSEGKIYLDMRKLEGRAINLWHSVSETSANPPPADESSVQSVNSAFSLSKEATIVNAYFQKAAFRDDDVKVLGDPVPFSTGVLNIAYKYREFKLSDTITLLVRCEINGASKEGDEEMTFKVLNEYFPPDQNQYQTGTDWKTTMESQKTSIIMAEFRNNGCKMAKWTAQALLNSSKQFKLGFVSRQTPKNATSHLILGTEKYRPEDFAEQLHLNLYNMWGVVKVIIESVQRYLQETNKQDCELVLLKHPNRDRLDLYETPDVAEEGEDEEASLASDEEEAEDDESIVEDEEPTSTTL
ncbi:hypothetical protein FDP41_011904 [Naegleria fowleri]|uniref:Eukaryotic translation initiation factor 3 subunit 7 n=1 Tax=Naegleria fowleri TaxID=5763 RepID=A0A6A5BVD4_NAEFO|nr:uncharacterized protein FDP41_011904 [Naegleria fowleri]KAF0982043.1 hypothetical protein FDP41_011904 [Naegleria fowleri]CAG4717642.1 unnamed protein product [Naegleria fowleri]